MQKSARKRMAELAKAKLNSVVSDGAGNVNRVNSADSEEVFWTQILTDQPVQEPTVSAFFFAANPNNLIVALR